MDFKSKAIDITEILGDASLQVRASLDEEYIDDLVIVFEENRHSELPPVVLFRDADGLLWLADGYHRKEAATRAGNQSLRAEVREGSKDEARLFAARANCRNGMRLSSGDKTRAVHMAADAARKTGKAWGVRELARHVGCAPSLVSKALGAFTGEHVGVAEVDPKAPTRAVGLLWSRIDAALLANPDRLSTSIAESLSCDERAVRDRRKALGLPPISRGAASRAKNVERMAALRRAVAASPGRTNESLAREFNSCKGTVAAIRSELGLPPRRQGPAATNSAPIRQSGDPRDGADAKVIHMRPAGTARPDPWVTRMVQEFERATVEQRTAFLEAVEQRWPGSRAG